MIKMRLKRSKGRIQGSLCIEEREWIRLGLSFTEGEGESNTSKLETMIILCNPSPIGWFS
jgi:hypothetical protein